MRAAKGLREKKKKSLPKQLNESTIDCDLLTLLSPFQFRFAPSFFLFFLLSSSLFSPLLNNKNGRRRLPQARLVARGRLVLGPQALAARHGAGRRGDGRRRVQGVLDVREARNAPRRAGQADPVEEVERRPGGEDRSGWVDEPGEVRERGRKDFHRACCRFFSFIFSDLFRVALVNNNTTTSPLPLSSFFKCRNGLSLSLSFTHKGGWWWPLKQKRGKSWGEQVEEQGKCKK